MRLSTFTGSVAPVLNLPAPVTIECHGCGTVEHRRKAVLPEGWRAVEAAEDVHAYCGDCASSAPERWMQ